MRIDPALAVNFGVVPPTAPCTASDVSSGICTQVGASQKGMCRSGLSTSNRATIQTPGGPSQQAAVVLVSHGANGYGAFVAGSLSTGLNGQRLPFPITAPSCANGGFESCNADENIVFVNSQIISDKTNPFDDSLQFLDRNNLVSMIGGGTCHTVW